MDYLTKERLKRLAPYAITVAILLLVGLLNLNIRDSVKPL